MSIWFVNGHHPVTDESFQDGMPRRLQQFRKCIHIVLIPRFSESFDNLIDFVDIKWHVIPLSE